MLSQERKFSVERNSVGETLRLRFSNKLPLEAAAFRSALGAPRGSPGSLGGLCARDFSKDRGQWAPRGTYPASDSEAAG